MKRFLVLSLAAALALSGCNAAASQTGAAVSAVTSAVSEPAVVGTVLDCTGTENVTISKAGSYTLSGDLQGCVVVDVGKNDKVDLILQNLTVTAADGPALWVRQADKVTITLAEGTASTLTDGSVYTDQTDEEPNAALFCDADLTIQGTGALTVTLSACLTHSAGPSAAVTVRFCRISSTLSFLPTSTTTQPCKSPVRV